MITGVTAPTPHIFISYSRRDGRDAAETIESILQNNGIVTWRDTRDIDPFRDFTADIETRIETASHVIVCITDDSKRSDSFVRREIQYALLANKPVIPVRFVDTPPHISLINFQWIDYFVNAATARERLLALVRHGNHRVGAHVVPDRFRQYAEWLYRHTVTFLQQAVLSLVDLHVDVARGGGNMAGTEADMLPQFYIGQGLNPAARACEFRSFHDAVETFAGRVLLLGSPGSGKTITMMALARDAAAARLSDAIAPLPLLGFIPTWDAQNRPALAVWLAAGLPFLSTNDITAEIERGDALLILDSLDELGDDRIILRELVTGENVVKERFDPRERVC